MEEETLLPKSFIQLIRSSLAHVYNNVQSNSKPQTIWLNIILIIYISSVGFYALLPSNTLVFDRNSNIYNIIKFINIFYRVTGYNTKLEETDMILFYITLGLYLISMSLFLLGYIVIKRIGKIPPLFANFIEFVSIFLTRFLLLGFTGFLGTSAHGIITNPTHCGYQYYLVFFISLLFEYFHLFIFCTVINNQINYEKGRSWGWTSDNQNRAILFIQTFALTTRIAECSNGTIEYVFLSISILISLIFVVIPYLLPIVISVQLNSVWLSCSDCALVIMIVILVFRIIGYTVPSNEIFIIYIVLLIGVYFVMSYLNRRRIVQGIQKIDIWASTGEELDVLFKSPLSFLYCFRVAFVTGNMNVINWHIVREALRVWPSSTILWRQSIIFMTSFAADAKILEETVIIYQTTLGYKDPTSVPFVKLAYIVIDARKKETKPKLKHSIQRQIRSINHFKATLSLFWDGIITGQISSSYTLASHAYDTLIITDADFKQLCQEYPNSFQLHAEYARFIEQCAGDAVGASQLWRRAQILRDSKLILDDRTERAMHEMFPMLPEKPQEIESPEKVEPLHDDADILSSSVSANSYVGTILEGKEEVTEESASSIFDKGYVSKPIFAMRIILVFMFIFVFVTGTAVPSVLMLNHYNRLESSVHLMSSVSYLPVVISRVDAALMLKAMRREQLIISQEEFEQIFSYSNNVTLEMVLDEIFNVYQSRVDEAEADNTKNAGFDTDTQSYLSQTRMEIVEPGPSGGTISHTSSLSEALSTFFVKGTLLVNDKSSDKWITDSNEELNLLLWNGDTLADHLAGFLATMHDSIEIQAKEQGTIVETVVGAFLIITILASIGCYIASVNIRLNFEHMTHVMSSIPKAAFFISNSKNEDKENKEDLDDKEDTIEKKIRFMHGSNHNVAKSIPTKKVGVISLSFVIIIMALDVVMIITLSASNDAIARTPQQMELISRIETGITTVAFNMLRICAMSQGAQIGGNNTQTTAETVIQEIGLVRDFVNELLLDDDHGTLLNSISEMNQVFFRGEFLHSNNLHFAYKDTQKVVGLQIMLEDAQRKMEAVIGGASVARDDHVTAAFVHEVLYHQYSDLMDTFYEAAIDYSSDNIRWKKVLVIVYLVIGNAFGIFLLIYANVGIGKMQKIINFIINRLKFLNQKEVLACTPLIRMLSGADSRHESTKDLTFIESADKSSSTPAFILSARRQILWANEAAMEMCGSRTIINDTIDGFLSFEKKEVDRALMTFVGDVNEEIRTKITVLGQKRKKHVVKVTSVREKQGRLPVFALTVDSLANIKEKRTAIKEIEKRVKRLQEMIVPPALSDLMGKSTGIVIDRATTLCIRLHPKSEVMEVQQEEQMAEEEDTIELEDNTKKEEKEVPEQQHKEEEEEKDVVLDTRSSMADIALPASIREEAPASILASIAENDQKDDQTEDQKDDQKDDQTEDQKNDQKDDQKNDQKDDQKNDQKIEEKNDALAMIKTLDDVSTILQNCNEKNCAVAKRIGFTFLVVTNINGKAAGQRESLSYALDFLARIRNSVAEQGVTMSAATVFSPRLVAGRPNTTSANFNIYAPEVHDAIRMVSKLKPGMLLISPQCNPNRDQLQFVVGHDQKQTNLVPIDTLPVPDKEGLISSRILDIVSN